MQYLSSRFVSLDMLYFKSVAIMMHDVNNLTPPNIYSLFTHQADIHPYEKRSSLRGDYFLTPSKTDIQKNYFSRIDIKIWNSLSCELRQMSKPNFSNNVHIFSPKDY